MDTRTPATAARTRRRPAAPLAIEGIMNDLRRVFRSVGVLSRRAEAVTGLSAPALWTLRTLTAAGPSTPEGLSRRMRLHPATVAGFLESLEARGLVASAPPSGRARTARLVATDQGAYVGSRAPQVPQIVLLEGLGRLSRERLRAVSSAMRLLVRILDAQGAPAQLLFSQEVNRPRRRRRARR